MASVKQLCTWRVDDFLAEIKGCLPIPERLYIRSSYTWTDTKILRALPDIIRELHEAELHRRTLCILFASDKNTWDTYIKVIIVHGPDLSKVKYRPVAVRDVPGQEKRARWVDQRLHAQNAEMVKNSSGDELAEARMKLHATTRLGLEKYEKLATRRYKAAMRSRGLYGRGREKRCCSSSLRAVVTCDSMAAEDELLGPENRLGAWFARIFEMLARILEYISRVLEEQPTISGNESTTSDNESTTSLSLSEAGPARPENQWIEGSNDIHSCPQLLSDLVG